MFGSIACPFDDHGGDSARQKRGSTGAKQGGGGSPNFTGISRSCKLLLQDSYLFCIKPHVTQVQLLSVVHGVAAVHEIQSFIYFPPIQIFPPTDAKCPLECSTCAHHISPMGAARGASDHSAHISVASATSCAHRHNFVIYQSKVIRKTKFRPRSKK